MYSKSLINTQNSIQFIIFFRTSDSHLNRKSSLETVTSTKEEPSIMIKTIMEDENQSITDTISSKNLFDELEQTLSSSSELDLSIALQSLNDSSSLSLTAFDNEQKLTTDDECMSLTPTQLTSDNESVLYSRLSDELNIAEATFDSDVERIGR
jgi:hypothetical protein